MTGPQEEKASAGARVGVPSHEKPCSNPFRKMVRLLPCDCGRQAQRGGVSWGNGLIGCRTGTMPRGHFCLFVRVNYQDAVLEASHPSFSTLSTYGPYPSLYRQP
jgi:hypothetical protein